MHLKWSYFIKTVQALVSIIGLLVLLSCGSSMHVQTPYSGSWEMNVVLAQGYRMEILDRGEPNIVPAYNDAVVSNSYRFFFRESNVSKLEAIKARLLSLGALHVRLVRLE